MGGIRSKRRDIISFNQVKNGCLSYLLVAGGIDIPIILGSKSTYLRVKIEEQKGRPLRPLKKSDIINIGKANQELQTITGKLELACESTATE